ncbi:MAG: hypothetical protein ABI807_05035 [Sporichthyaceae bacterium]
MFAPSRHHRRRRALTVAVALALLGALAPAAGAQSATVAATATATAPHAGLVGVPTTLQDNTQLYGYDVATDGTGTGYIGWIADDSAAAAATRRLHLCTLPVGATACAGGVQVIDALGVSSAAGLRVLATPAGAVSLVWFHDTSPGSVTGPRGGRLAVATSQSGGPLSAATDVADAPSFGQLLDAQIAPDGTIWTIAYKGVGTTEIEVRPGFAAAPQSLAVPYSVATTRLAFAGATAVIAVQQYGSISNPIFSAHGTAGAWSGFTPVANTWSGGSLGLAAARSGVRLVASVANASYHPAAARFTGTGFASPRLIGDPNSCTPYSHDLVGDASGRLADVSNECGAITVVNMAHAATAAIVRFSAGGTVADGDPQIASTPRGRAWVAWSVQSSTGNKLRVARVLLPALRIAKRASFAQGKVVVRGPVSCLPPVGVAVGVTRRPLHGWAVSSTSLRLDKRRFSSATLDGSRLTPGSLHTLAGRVVFTRGGKAVTRTVTRTFRSCSNP